MCVNHGSVAVRMKKSSQELIVNEGEGVFINSESLPEKKQYAWTKKLNWKMKGDLNEVQDKAKTL